MERSIVTTKGGKPTHDFLSLYSQTNTPSDALSHVSHASGSLVETHDFLQPLERAEDNAEPRKMEHVLPGGIGTYSISHISYYNQQPLVRGCTTTIPSDDNNISSTGFKLWDESSTSIAKTHQISDPEEPPSKPFNCKFPSPSSQLPSGSKHQSFIEIMKSGRSDNRDEDLEEDDGSSLKREYSSSGGRGELSARVDGKSWEQKASTPRSKHSATEQRRRSKINDRFQMLREIIPQTDQKRDKASFLLEVIEYIQFLQVKVRKYEECYPSKLTHWGSRSDGGAADLSRGPTSDNNEELDMRVEDGLKEHGMRVEDGLKEHGMRVEGGSISLSNVYSQGLLDTLTRALQTSGVDLTQANLSVQIDIGKRASSCPGSSKENSEPVPKHEPISPPVAKHQPISTPVPKHQPISTPVPKHPPISPPVPKHEPISSPVPKHQPIRSTNRGIAQSDQPFKKPRIA